MEKYKKYTKDHFSNIVLNSFSVTEIMQKLNLSNCNGNRRTIKKYIKKYNINCEHFIRNTFIKRETYEKKSLEDIMVVNSHYPTAHLKERLYKEGMKERICEICGQDENWRDRKISLILDHINGVNNDHRIENLRIVCPNCNASLETFAGRNSKKVKNTAYCDCGEEISYGAKKCDKCSRLSRRKTQRPELEILKNDVSNLGYTGTGKKYGVSDVCIKKWIKNYKNYGLEIDN